MDFDACRFDFRLDSKNGLTPSKRKKSERRGTCYNTLFKCKVCGSLFDHRAALLEHKLIHNDYKCPICGVKVSRKATLREHLQVIHGLGKVKASPEELEEEKAHKINMKEHMNVVRGMVSRKPRGGAAAAAKLAPKPATEVPIMSGAVMMGSSPPSPSPAMSPTSAAMTVSPSTAAPTTMQGYMCINVPIFIPSSGSTSSTQTSTATSVPSTPTLLPILPQPPGMQAGMPGAMPIQPSLSNSSGAQPHMLLPVNQPSSSGGTTGAVTVPVNATNSPIIMSGPVDSPHSHKDESPPPLVPPQREDLEPGEIRRPPPIPFPQTPVLQMAAPPPMPLEGQMPSIAIKCEDGQVRFFPLQHGIPPPPQLIPQLIPVNSGGESIPTPPNVVEVKPIGDREDEGGVLNLVMRKDEDGTEEWGNSFIHRDQPEDLSVKTPKEPERFIISDVYSLAGNSVMNETPDANEVIDLSVKSPEEGHSPISTPPIQENNSTKGRKRGLDMMVAKLWQTKIKGRESPQGNSRSGTPTGTKHPSPAHRASHPTNNQKSSPMIVDDAPLPNKRARQQQSQQPQQEILTNKFHTCKVCKQLFDNAEDMWEHAVQHEEFHRLRCNVCDYKAPSITDMVKHNYQEHGEMFPPTPNPLPKTPVAKEGKKEEYYCSVCGIGFTDTVKLRDHVMQHSDDGRTEFVCEYDRCKLKFTSNRDLWYHIEKDHLSKLVNPKKYGCPADGCDRRFASLNHLKRHMVAHSDERPIACAFPGCEKKFKEVQNLRKHQSKHMGHAPSRCMLCNFACEEPSQMSAHMKERHWMDAQVMLGARIMDGVLEEEEPPLPEVPRSEQNSGENSPNENNEKSESSNTRNARSAEQQAMMSNRAASDSRSGYFTTVMKIKYNTSGQATLTEEKSSYHPTENKFHVCKICKQLFESALKMWSHRLVEHDELNKMYCELCGFSTESRLELETHAMTVHHQELPDTKEYTCCWCGKIFSSRHGFRHHVMKHSEEGPPQYPCPMDGCTQTFLSRLAIKLHMKQVHPQPPPAAPTADMSPSSPLSDSGDRILYCDFPGCDKNFREGKHLKVHKMLHTDEKPLKCGLCDYSCRQRNSMNWHMKSKHNMQKQVTPDGRTIYI